MDIICNITQYVLILLVSILWLTCKLADAFPQILLVISAGRIETIAKCNDHIKHCIVVLHRIVLYTMLKKIQPIRMQENH